MIKLLWPTIWAGITQKFGDNFIYDSPIHPEWNGKWFYGGVIPGLKSHNGTDVVGNRGDKVIAAHNGYIDRWDESNGAIYVRLEALDGATMIETLYAHCLSLSLPVKATIKAGDIIGMADNRGLYTTGDHVHFELREYAKTAEGWWKKNTDNGTAGSINPEPYLVKWGQLIKTKDNPDVWVSKDNIKRQLSDKLALFVLGATGYIPVIEVSSSEFNKIPVGTPISYTYQDLNLTAEQLKDFLRTFKENPAEADSLYNKYF